VIILDNESKGQKLKALYQRLTPQERQALIGIIGVLIGGAITILIFFAGWIIQSGGKQDLKDQLRAVTAERDTAQTRLAPFLAIADKQFTTNPQNERLTLLLEKLNQKLERAPDFDLFINDLQVGTNKCIKFFTTNDSQALVFSLHNRGNAEAEQLSLTVTLPDAVDVTGGGGWHQGVTGRRENKRKIYFSAKVFIVEADHMLAMGKSVIFEPITIHATNLNYSTDLLTLSVDAKNSVNWSMFLWLKFQNGTGPAEFCD